MCLRDSDHRRMHISGRTDSLPKFGRCHGGVAFEDARQVALVGEACFCGDLRDSLIRIKQSFARQADAKPLNPLSRSLSTEPPENASQIDGMDASLSC